MTTQPDNDVPRRADAFLHDALTEIFLAAERKWWLQRALELEQARPRPGEFHGAATRDQLGHRWHRLTEMAQACRARAQVSPVAHIREDVANVLREAS